MSYLYAEEEGVCLITPHMDQLTPSQIFFFSLFLATFIAIFLLLNSGTSRLHMILSSITEGKIE